ncbi:MAG TPA: OmpA family protein, partial [Saprospiraceae bacterium]|nr:OmpA family protein [Saprospiraceae bacterium]
TDDLGNDEKNQVLSEQRAQIVADYLIAHGLDKSRIRTKGYGGTKPIYVNPATENERALNRRVEIRAKM